jgi:hypothetical protein
MKVLKILWLVVISVGTIIGIYSIDDKQLVSFIVCLCFLALALIVAGRYGIRQDSPEEIQKRIDFTTKNREAENCN